MREARRRRTVLRIGLSAAGTALALAVGWTFLARSEEPETVAFLDQGAGLRKVLAERAASQPADGGGEGLEREVIPPAQAEVLFAQLRSPQANIYDPQALFIYRPHLERQIPFKAHPKGRWILRTNGLGLRRDTEVADERPDLRILVTGDSHTDGVCDNAETFAARLEERLGAVRAGRTVEVLNAGKAGYSFYNYLGILEKYLSLEPQFFVVAVYGGNDFLETVDVHRWHRHLAPRPLDAELSRAQEDFRDCQGAFGQVLQQALFFHRHPEEVEVAFEAAVGVSAEIARLCEEHGIRPIFFYLPAFFDVQRERFDPPAAELERRANLDPGAFALTGELADAWIDALAARGIKVVDARPAFAQAAETLYWPRDHHLNLAGHELAAELLERALEE